MFVETGSKQNSTAENFSYNLSKAKTIHKDDHLDQVGNVIFVETGSR
jgi:hypothetical protein